MKKVKRIGVVIFALLICLGITNAKANEFEKTEELVTGKNTLATVAELKIEATGEDTSRLSWKPVNDVDGYVIYRKQAGGTYYKISMVQLPYFNDSNLKVGIQYVYKVCSYKNVNGEKLMGADSNEVTIKLLPKPALGLEAKVLNKNTVRLDWKGLYRNNGGYIIYRKTGNENFKYIGMSKDSAYFDDKAKLGEINFYRVYPYEMLNGKRVMGPSKEYTYAKPLPGTVSGIKAQATAASTVKLTWNTVADADGYIIYRKIGDGKFTYRYMVKGNSYIDTTAKTGEYNFYRIYSYKNKNGKRILSLSNQYVYKRPIASPVSNISVSKSGYSALNLKWNEVTGSDGYIIYHKDSNEPRFTYLGMTSNTSYLDKQIFDDCYHFYRVYAYKNINNQRMLNESAAYVYGKAHTYDIYDDSIPIQKVTLDQTVIKINVGEKYTLNAKVTPYKTSMRKYLFWHSDNNDVASVHPDGVVTAYKEGTATITVATGDGKKAICKVIVSDPVKRGTASGFSIAIYTVVDTFKHTSVASRNEDGGNTYKIEFLTNGNEKWLDQDVTFEITDVTPIAYKKMFNDMGIKQQKLSYVIESAEQSLEFNKYQGYEETVLEPFTSDGPVNRNVLAKSGKIITIKAGMSTRSVKVVAKINGKIIDTVYVSSSSYKAESESLEYSQHDMDLFKKVRKIIESQLWLPVMTNYDKLQIMEYYINHTTHYPRQYIVSKETNPEFWRNWAVDDKVIFYDISGDVLLNNIMLFQGGVTTCTAAEILFTVAIEDLGLKNLYDKKNNTIKDGEGVWLGYGSASTNPSNPYHVTLWYKSADNKVIPLNAQGMGFQYSFDPFFCHEHNCVELIIPLK